MAGVERAGHQDILHLLFMHASPGTPRAGSDTSLGSSDIGVVGLLLSVLYPHLYLFWSAYCLMRRDGGSEASWAEPTVSSRTKIG